MEPRPEPAAAEEPSWASRLGPARPVSPVAAAMVPALTVLTGQVCGLLAIPRHGVSGLVAGLAAGIVVAAFFALGRLPVQVFGASLGAGLGLGLLLLNFAVRLALALLVLGALVDAGYAASAPTGVALIACTLVGVNAQLIVHRAVGGT